MSAPDLSRGVRASDAERERIAELLQRAAAEGRLSPEEAGERLAAASTATYRDELNELVADLPVARDREPAERLVRRPPAVWWLQSAARLAIVALVVMTFWGFWVPDCCCGRWGLWRSPSSSVGAAGGGGDSGGGD